MTKLYDPLTADDQALIQRDGITLDVVKECGGVSEHGVELLAGLIHDPRACKHPNCGQYRARRGERVAFGKTPRLALEALTR